MKGSILVEKYGLCKEAAPRIMIKSAIDSVWRGADRIFIDPIKTKKELIDAVTNFFVRGFSVGPPIPRRNYELVKGLFSKWYSEGLIRKGVSKTDVDRFRDNILSRIASEIM